MKPSRILSAAVTTTLLIFATSLQAHLAKLIVRRGKKAYDRGALLICLYSLGCSGNPALCWVRRLGNG